MFRHFFSQMGYLGSNYQKNEFFTPPPTLISKNYKLRNRSNGWMGRHSHHISAQFHIHIHRVRFRWKRHQFNELIYGLKKMSRAAVVQHWPHTRFTYQPRIFYPQKQQTDQLQGTVFVWISRAPLKNQNRQILYTTKNGTNVAPMLPSTIFSIQNHDLNIESCTRQHWHHFLLHKKFVYLDFWRSL